MNVDEVLQLLKEQKANLRCSELCKIMKSMGFTVELTKRGHWKVKHYGLNGFHGAGFACGHGKDGKVLPVYPSKMRQIIEEHKSELMTILDEK